jgi:Zn-dependent peptidase ImmA (M78 family)
MFLNTFKSAEHSIFDSIHELCHLCCHRHAGSERSRFAEREAQAFASAFLMPAADVRARMPRFITPEVIFAAKKRWRVSAMAMAYRLHALGLLTEWRYKSLCIELGRRGYRTGEPVGIERETSTVWKKILAQLWAEKTTKSEIARGLNFPPDEVENLVWGLTGPVGKPAPTGPEGLRVIK